MLLAHVLHQWKAARFRGSFELKETELSIPGRALARYRGTRDRAQASSVIFLALRM